MSARRSILLIAILAISLILRLTFLEPALAAGPDMSTVVEMINNHQAVTALQLVIDTASDLGGWGPAPGDVVIYDEALPWWVRGEVLTADLPPAECAIPRFSQSDCCNMPSAARERQVRFGHALFVNTNTEGEVRARPQFDDVLSTYIEEMGHSWQEYLYETSGLGSGPRTILTSWEEAIRWIPGREYQIKRYVLEIDGGLFTLSAEERALLLACICDSDGYANPLGRDVPPYGAPTGWPDASKWPTHTPSVAELQAFCEAG